MKNSHVGNKKGTYEAYMTNKKLIFIATVLLMAGCGNNEKKQAEQLLQEARTHFLEGKLEEARADIDSLRKTFPNIVEARKGALKLHQDIELKAAQDELARTDSLLQIANKELETMQKEVEDHKAALKATPEELTALTRMRMRRDSIRTQFETLGMKISYIRQKQKEQ